jgi:hypothetical protein
VSVRQWQALLMYKTVKLFFYMHSTGEHDKQMTLNVELTPFFWSVRFQQTQKTDGLISTNQFSIKNLFRKGIFSQVLK